jgi:hypothetical protein
MLIVLIRVSPSLKDSAATRQPGRYMRRLTSCRTPWHSTHIPATLKETARLLDIICGRVAGASCVAQGLSRHASSGYTLHPHAPVGQKLKQLLHQELS